MRRFTRLAFLFLLVAAPGIIGTGLAATATVVQVAGLSHVIALKSDGTVTGWGRNDYGQLGEATGVPVRDHHYPVQPVAIALPGKAVSIGVGNSTSYAVMEDGTLLAWGGGRRGELGNGIAIKHGWASAPAPAPIRVQGLPQITQISAGSAHMLALAADGRVYSWGSNNAAELGHGGRSERGVSVPAEVQGLTGVVAIAAGKEVSSALKSDGTVWVWGSNLHGQHGNGVLEKHLRVPTPFVLN